MCIPCVMCGACMGEGNGDTARDGLCPECGAPVPPDAVSCPSCFTFLYRKPPSAGVSRDDGASGPGPTPAEAG